MLIPFMFGADLTSLLFHAKQVRARLTVLKTRDATAEQVAIDAECRREEERQRLVTQQAKNVQSITLFIPLSWDRWILLTKLFFPVGTLLVLRRKKPIISLPVSKW